TRNRVDITQGADQRRFVDAEKAEPIVRVGWEAGALRDEIEDAELACDPGVLELERRIEIDDAIIPAELAAIDHDAHGGGEKCLGGRTDLKQRAGINRHAPRF